jgi:hypothetical protein
MARALKPLSLTMFLALSSVLSSAHASVVVGVPCGEGTPGGSTLGVTTMSDDHTDILACLLTQPGSNVSIWKPETAGYLGPSRFSTSPSVVTDVKTGLFTPGPDKVAVSTDSVEMMDVTPNGIAIGTTQAPLAVLHVVGTPTTNPITNGIVGGTNILVESNSVTANTPRITFVDTSLGPNSSAPTWSIDEQQNRFRIFQQPNLQTVGPTYFQISSVVVNGVTAVNTGVSIPDWAFPQSTLDVNGEVRVGNSGIACGATNVGALRWNGANFQGCDGSNWRTLAFQ